MNLDAVLGGVIVVSDLDPAVQREALVFQEVRITANEVGNGALPGATERVLAKGQGRLEEDRALRIVIKRVGQIARCASDVAALFVNCADVYQAVAPSLLRGIDHVLADWA